MNRVRARIKLTDNERNTLNQLARSTTVIHGLASRAKILLYAEREQNNTVVAKKLGAIVKSGVWRQIRFPLVDHFLRVRHP